MTRTVLITGATGTVSTALLNTLTAQDVAVRALVHDERKADGPRGQGAEVFVADLDDARSLPPAFEGVHDLWLLTPNGPRAPENNMNVLWAARRAGVERVVRLSVSARHTTRRTAAAGCTRCPTGRPNVAACAGRSCARTGSCRTC
ncbi:SDR family oxidoreductase [Embleya sp. NPDC001921]